MLTAQPAGSPPIRIAPQRINGRTVYTAMLPAGTIREGSFTVTGAGGRDVGPFTTSVNIPAPIELTTTFPPGTAIPVNLLDLAWKGGTPGATVRVTFVGKGRTMETLYEYEGPASANTLIVAYQVVTRIWDCCKRTSAGDAPAEIIITVRPDPGQDQVFQAPGLTLGGRHGWIYEFRFTDLKL